jgi:hypothetical protein
MKTTQQLISKSRRLFYFSAILSFLIPAASQAEIYKCKNTETGMIEYQQRPCDDTQSAQALKGAAKPSSNNRRTGELIYKNQLVNDLGGEVTEECIAKLSKRGASRTDAEQQCKAAMDKFAFCVVDAQKSVFPKKANDVFFTELENGKSEEDARLETKKPENWGNFSQDQRIKTMFLLQGKMEMCKDDFKKIYYK